MVLLRKGLEAMRYIVEDKGTGSAPQVEWPI